MKKLYYALAGLSLAVAAQGTAMLTAAPEASLPSVTSVETSKTFEEYVTFAMPMYGGTVDLAENYSGVGVLSFYLNTSLTVNKECPFSVTLYKDGAALKSLPATDETYIVSMDGSIMFIMSETPITADGNYALEIPDGFLLDGTTPVKGCTFNYTIGATKTISFLECINPEEGTPIDTPLDMKEFGSIKQFAFQTIVNIKINESCTTPICLYAGDSATPLASIAATDKYDEADEEETKPFVFIPMQGMLVLNFGTRFTDPVDYRLVIPEGFFTVNGENVAATTLNYLFGPQKSATDFTQRIIAAMPELDVPVDLEEYESGLNQPFFQLNGNITVNPACATKLRINISGSLTAVATISAAATGETEPRIIFMEGAEPMTASAQGDVVTELVMYFGENPITAPGTYTITIPDEFFYIDGALCEKSTIIYTIEDKTVAPVEPVYEFSPAAGETVETLADIYFNVPSGNTVSIESGRATLSNGVDSYTLTTFQDSPTSPSVWMYNFSFPDTDGEWTITIPAGSLTYNGTVYDKDITATWTISSGSNIPVTDLTITPTPGSTLNSIESLKTITLTYPVGTTLEAGEEYSYVVSLTPPAPAWPVMYEVTSVKDNVATLATNADLSSITAGECTLSIGKGTVIVDGEPCAEATYTYTFDPTAAPAPEYYFDPADGATVIKLEDIYLHLTGGSVSYNMGGTEEFITISNGTDTKNLGAFEQGNSIWLFPTLPITEPGVWTITIPANRICFNGEPYNEVINATWTIENSAIGNEFPEPVLSLNPESVVSSTEEFNVITLTYPEGTTLELGEEDTYYATLNQPGLMSNANYIVAVDGNVVTLTANPAVSGLASGNYNLEISAGAFFWNGKANPAYLYTYTFEAPSVGEFNYTITPAPGTTVKDLSSITFTVEEGHTIGYNVTGYITDPEEVIKERLTGTATDNVLVLSNLTFGTEEGEWKLVLPAGSLVYDGNLVNYEITASWTVSANASGIEGISADDTFTVFTIDGKLLHKNAGIEAVSSLESGLYIINGKKVLVRK